MNSRSSLRTFFSNLRQKRIVEILAAFIAGDWLIIEFVDRILVAHYHFPDKTIDITFITLLCALICTLLWRWFSGREVPRKFKLELVLIPLVVLITVLLDINLLLHLKGPESETFSAAKWKNSIAVLPFVDMSPQKDQEYFCDGMTEELINRLSNIQELKVPARTSVFTFKGKAEDIREVGRKLNVQTLLEGSIRKIGNQLRVTAQLINIANGYHLWSETYDRELKDVFSIWDEIALTIADKLKLTLLSDEKTRLVKRPIDNVPAYDCYLRARAEIYQFSEEALDRAIQLLQNGLDIIGDNALLYSTMAFAYWQCVNLGVKQEDYMARSEEYVNKALALDPDSPQAQSVLATIFRDFRGNLREAVRHYKKALALDPNESTALMLLAYTYIIDAGMPAAGLPLIERFKNVDPLNPYYYGVLGTRYLFNNQYEFALDQFRKWHEIEPESPPMQYLYAMTLAHAKENEKAFLLVDKGAKATPNNIFTKMGLLLKYGFLKDKERAFREMTPDFQKTCKRDMEASYWVACMLSVLDARKEALDWFENAINRGFINYPALEREPFLENIRGEERFKKLMERVKYEWEHFKE